MSLALDFDRTITMEDTIEVLAQFAISVQRKRGLDLSETWEKIKARYEEDYEKYLVSFPSPEAQRISIEAEAGFLNGMKDLELASIRRVHSSGLFEGIQASEYRAAGEEAAREGKVRIRSGFGDLVDLARNSGWHVFVISINWSRPFIEGILSTFGDGIRVISNEIVEGHISCSALSTSAAARVLATSRDKLDALNSLGLHSRQPCMVYFGDSLTDLECLMLSSGVVISSAADSSLLKALARLSIQVQHISNGGIGGGLAWARNFSEVLRSDSLSPLFQKGIGGSQ